MQTAHRQRLYSWLGLALMLTASAFFVRYAINNWAALPLGLWHAALLPALLGATGGYLLTFVVTGFAWQRLLKGFGESATLAQAVVIGLLSQFAKYLPGNVGQHVGRAVLAHRAGWRKAAIGLSMVLELLLVLLAAMLSILMAIVANSSFAPNSSLLAQILGITALVCLPLLVLLRYVDPLLRKLASLMPAIGPISLKRPPLPQLLWCLLLYTGNFLLLGAILWLLAMQLGSGAAANFWLLTGSFALAWVAGFVTPGAPAGLGIRETIMVTLLEPAYGPGAALSLALLLRLITSLGDALAFLAGLWLNRRQRSRTPA
ncbi:lysylphosphatidylglycerol synthase domain-containing protein [Shewanella cyperi]|nr:lysylphosphatidylglycerol synthase domain-containing protein [Shewanella cyperi]QSX40441.1 flippase-like domain-containing protein [Shewanella cyperi]